MDHLEEITIESEIKWQGKFLKVYQDKVTLPNGNTSTREFVRHPGASAMLALTEDRQLILIRQYRYPCHKSFVEIPAGKLDAGETPEEAAKRELEEEVGITASKWTFLLAAEPCIGYSDEIIYYFLAEDLVWKQTNQDADEFLDIFQLPLDEAVAWAATGQISDGKTITGLFALEKYLKNVK